MGHASAASPFMTPEAFDRYLDGLGQFRMQLGMERMDACLRTLCGGAPPFPMARVVGTNGKGMTAWLLARLAAAHGLKVGLYTSPHFVSPRERVMFLHGNEVRMPDDAQWVELANTVYAAGPAVLVDAVCDAPRGLSGLTYFEFLTCMAVEHFTRCKVDLAVMEAGLGARYDATAVLRADIVCITRIGLDHEHILGRGLRAIAGEKGHALRQGARLAVTTEQRPEVLEVLERASREGGTPLVPASGALPLDPAEHMRLPGAHQARNGALALAAWRTLAQWRGMRLDLERCKEVLARAALPGRVQAVPALEGLHPPLLLDGAHNEDSLAALEAALQELGLRPASCIAALMADKDLEKLAPVIARMTDGAVFLPRLEHVPRAALPETLAPLVGERARVASSLAEALEMARLAHPVGNTPVLMCGSLYLLGEFFKLRPELVRFS